MLGDGGDRDRAAYRLGPRDGKLHEANRRGKSCLGTTLLEQSGRRIEHQETGDARGFDIFAEHQLEHDRSLEHPRDGRPEFFERHAQRMQRRVGHRVRAEFLQLTARLIPRQTDLQTDMAALADLGLASIIQSWPK